MRADYLAGLALNAGRAKDYTRILALIENKAVTSGAIAKLCRGRRGKLVGFPAGNKPET